MRKITCLAPRLELVFCLLLMGLCGIARADTWTNTAGHGIEAQAIALEGQTLVLMDTRGATLRLPLHSLSKDEQERAKKRFGVYEPPPALRQDFLRLQRSLERLAALHDYGRLSDHEFQQVRDEMRTDFELCYQRQSAMVSEEQYSEAAIHLFEGEKMQ